MKKKKYTYGSFDLGIKVPSSLMRSLMLNLRLRSTKMYHMEHTLSTKQLGEEVFEGLITSHNMNNHKKALTNVMGHLISLT